MKVKSYGENNGCAVLIPFLIATAYEMVICKCYLTRVSLSGVYYWDLPS